MKCPKCQHDNPENTKFCAECGASLAVDLDSLSPTKTILGPAINLRKGQKIAGKYKIIEKIGEGGMGIVYKAEDMKLKRNVTLKFLPAELMRDKKAKARFIQEAQAAAALNHPNICIIHEVDETDDQTFIAMEFIEGQTLRDKIEAGPLAVDKAIDIACQVAEGLGEAHKKGIIHRDIKPANIMLTPNGQAKIMDFGLAKLSWGADLTKPSMIMGTVAYMSPEQARGEPIDNRTDIWSLGAMFYEMLTGKKPFQKSHEQALIHSILNDEPKRISEVSSDVPAYVEKVIKRALEKNVDCRFQNVEQMLRELKQSPPIISAETKKSIVVLPFENLSSDPEQEYFCDGMTEEIISDLSQVHELLVISRSSAMMYKGTKKKIKEIGKELNVQYALEGSVRKAGNNLRITAQLIDTENDVHLWAGKYAGIIDDIFEIQEKVSLSIVEALKLKLHPDEKKKIKARPIDNVHTYDLHLRARYEMWLVSKERLDHAIQLIRKGLQIIGDNELLYFDLGQGHLLYHDFAIRKEESLFLMTEECIAKIFELNPESSYGHSLRGNLLRKKGKCQQAVREWKRSFALDPNNMESLGTLSWVYLHSGKVPSARPLIKTLLDVDPLMPLNHLIAGVAEIMEGLFELGLPELKKAHAMEKEVQPFHYWIGKSLAYSGHYQDAVDVFEAITKNRTGSVWENLSSFSTAALQKRKQDAVLYLTDDFKKMMREDEMYPLWIAENMALIGEKEEALAWLEHGRQCGFINYPFLNEYDPLLASIRSEAGFKKLMIRVKREWESFEV